MTAEHDRFADWDAAYILGTLSAADRERYEAHLADCALCDAAVAELAPLPGLLSRVPRERAASLLDRAGEPDEPGGGTIPAEPDPARRAEIIGIAEARSRRTRRLRWIGAAAAAAAVAAVVVLVPMWLAPDEAPVVALETVVDVPVTASVRIDDVAWGTRLTMTCRYDGAVDAPPGGWEYELVVVSADGAESRLSTWRAFPDRTAEIVAGTALRAADIAAVEVRSVRTGTVLLSTAAETTDDAP
ncbi:anti-sigma factor family protein [Microbacterium sp. NPDC058345]|uniref:anti-sigma factor family protein n=1 Tax=Microbacterium sp. NPDC058345 TaxID=3346455 RepID=UPI00365281E5